MFIPNRTSAQNAWTRAYKDLVRLDPPRSDVSTGCLIRSSGVSRPAAQCDGQQIPLARIGYIASGGVIPPQTECLRHICDDDRCVEPRHQQPGSLEDNVRDRMIRGRSRRIWVDGKCQREHDITDPANIIYVRRSNSESPGWTCRPCARWRGRQRA